MTRARSLSKLVNAQSFTVDSDFNVGVNSTSPVEKLNVVGVVSATSFFGDGSNLDGVASAGLGTALSEEGAGSVIYYTDTTLGIGSTVNVDPPSTTDIAYTQYEEVSLIDDADLIVAEGDDFVPDILGLSDGLLADRVGGSGSGGISNVVEDTSPQLGGNLDLNSKRIDGIGDMNITGDISVSGVITANSFSGTVPSSSLSGALPAIDGSALTNVTGTGSGIGVSNSGSSVGTAQTINFGSGLSITTVNSGFATVTVDTPSFATNSGFSTVSGISSALGVGATAIGLNATGIVTSTNVRINATSAGSGIITATTHVDSGIVTYRGDSSYAAAGRWVLGASGSDHYTFTGPGLGHSTLNDPTLYLMRGQTYMFENKMGAHPFRIQITSNGSVGNQWNVGVTNNDVSNGVLIFEVPFNCPNTLYYQCTAHANMGGALNIVT